MKQFVNKVIEGDCLEVCKQFASESIDMVLCDLPYGETMNPWDREMDLVSLWIEYKRIVKSNGAIVLTSHGLFTAKLMLSNADWFKYKLIWIKSKATNFLNAKKQPLRKYEDVCVFYKKQPVFNPQMQAGQPYMKGIRKKELTGSYGKFRPTHVQSNGERYPTDIIYFATAETEEKVVHPTQKPVSLGRYLIRTYTNPRDLVLDNASGSGSFLVAAVLEQRNFIGIEKNEQSFRLKNMPVDFIKISQERIKKAQQQRQV